MIHETCFDRDYECCDLTPPPDGLRYDEWYDSHVEAWQAHQSAVRASKQAVPGGADSALDSDDPAGRSQAVDNPQ